MSKKSAWLWLVLIASVLPSCMAGHEALSAQCKVPHSHSPAVYVGAEPPLGCQSSSDVTTLTSWHSHALSQKRTYGGDDEVIYPALTAGLLYANHKVLPRNCNSEWPPLFPTLLQTILSHLSSSPISEMGSHIPPPTEQDSSRSLCPQLEGVHASPCHHHDSPEKQTLSFPF